MKLLAVFWGILFGLIIFGDVVELYPTNFLESFRWKSKQVYYGTPGRVSDIEFRNFVSNSINKFTDLFGNYFEWIFEEDVDDLKKHKRYLIFDKRMLQPDAGCASAWWPNTVRVFKEEMLLGKNTIWIAVRRFNGEIACDTEDIIRLILATFGFYPLTSRIDRDEHIHFQWDLKPNVFKDGIPKRYDLTNSSNPIFKHFDLASIHMPASVGIDHNVPSWPPLFVPVHNNTENWENILNSDKIVTEIDVKQFQAIYHD